MSQVINLPTGAPPTETSDELEGFNTLLMGPAGTAKTYSIGTLVDAVEPLGGEVFFLSLEPGLESLYGYWKDKGKPIPSNLRVHKLARPKASFKEAIESAKQINLLSLDALAKQVDPNKSKHNRFVQLLEALNDFPDDRTGKKFGAVDSWTPKRFLVIDGMTGINNAAMSLVIGGKPVRSQSDWGIAQDQVEKILRNLTEGCDCHVVVLAHIERDTDQVLGGTKLMVASLGKALTPKIAPMFSDVILAVRNGTTWTWDTSNPMADVKGRNLPFQAGLPADFGQIVKKWIGRGGKIA